MPSSVPQKQSVMIAESSKVEVPVSTLVGNFVLACSNELRLEERPQLSKKDAAASYGSLHDALFLLSVDEHSVERHALRRGAATSLSRLLESLSVVLQTGEGKGEDSDKDEKTNKLKGNENLDRTANTEYSADVLQIMRDLKAHQASRPWLEAPGSSSSPEGMGRLEESFSFFLWQIVSVLLSREGLQSNSQEGRQRGGLVASLQIWDSFLKPQVGETAGSVSAERSARVLGGLFASLLLTAQSAKKGNEKKGEEVTPVDAAVAASRLSEDLEGVGPSEGMKLFGIAAAVGSSAGVWTSSVEIVERLLKRADLMGRLPSRLLVESLLDAVGPLLEFSGEGEEGRDGRTIKPIGAAVATHKEMLKAADCVHRFFQVFLSPHWAALGPRLSESSLRELAVALVFQDMHGDVGVSDSALAAVGKQVMRNRKVLQGLPQDTRARLETAVSEAGEGGALDDQTGLESGGEVEEREEIDREDVEEKDREGEKKGGLRVMEDPEETLQIFEQALSTKTRKVEEEGKRQTRTKSKKIQKKTEEQEEEEEDLPLMSLPDAVEGLPLFLSDHPFLMSQRPKEVINALLKAFAAVQKLKQEDEDVDETAALNGLLSVFCSRSSDGKKTILSPMLAQLKQAARRNPETLREHVEIIRNFLRVVVVTAVQNEQMFAGLAVFRFSQDLLHLLEGESPPMSSFQTELAALIWAHAQQRSTAGEALSLFEEYRADRGEALDLLAEREAQITDCETMSFGTPLVDSFLADCEEEQGAEGRNAFLKADEKLTALAIQSCARLGHSRRAFEMMATAEIEAFPFLVSSEIYKVGIAAMQEGEGKDLTSLEISASKSAFSSTSAREMFSEEELEKNGVDPFAPEARRADLATLSLRIGSLLCQVSATGSEKRLELPLSSVWATAGIVFSLARQAGEADEPAIRAQIAPFGESLFRGVFARLSAEGHVLPPSWLLSYLEAKKSCGLGEGAAGFSAYDHKRVAMLLSTWARVGEEVTIEREFFQGEEGAADLNRVWETEEERKNAFAQSAAVSLSEQIPVGSSALTWWRHWCADRAREVLSQATKSRWTLSLNLLKPLAETFAWAGDSKGVLRLLHLAEKKGITLTPGFFDLLLCPFQTNGAGEKPSNDWETVQAVVECAQMRATEMSPKAAEAARAVFTSNGKPELASRVLLNQAAVQSRLMTTVRSSTDEHPDLDTSMAIVQGLIDIAPRAPALSLEEIRQVMRMLRESQSVKRKVLSDVLMHFLRYSAPVLMKLKEMENGSPEADDEAMKKAREGGFEDEMVVDGECFGMIVEALAAEGNRVEAERWIREVIARGPKVASTLSGRAVTAVTELFSRRGLALELLSLCNDLAEAGIPLETQHDMYVFSSMASKGLWQQADAYLTSLVEAFREEEEEQENLTPPPHLTVFVTETIRSAAATKSSSEFREAAEAAVRWLSALKELGLAPERQAVRFAMVAARKSEDPELVLSVLRVARSTSESMDAVLLAEEKGRGVRQGLYAVEEKEGESGRTSASAEVEEGAVVWPDAFVFGEAIRGLLAGGRVEEAGELVEEVEERLGALEDSASKSLCEAVARTAVASGNWRGSVEVLKSGIDRGVIVVPSRELGQAIVESAHSQGDWEGVLEAYAFLRDGLRKAREGLRLDIQVWYDRNATIFASPEAASKLVRLGDEIGEKYDMEDFVVLGAGADEEGGGVDGEEERDGELGGEGSSGPKILSRGGVVLAGASGGYGSAVYRCVLQALARLGRASESLEVRTEMVEFERGLLDGGEGSGGERSSARVLTSGDPEVFSLILDAGIQEDNLVAVAECLEDIQSRLMSKVTEKSTASREKSESVEKEEKEERDAQAGGGVEEGDKDQAAVERVRLLQLEKRALDFFEEVGDPQLLGRYKSAAAKRETVETLAALAASVQDTAEQMGELKGMAKDAAVQQLTKAHEEAEALVESMLLKRDTIRSAADANRLIDLIDVVSFSPAGGGLVFKVIEKATQATNEFGLKLFRKSLEALARRGSVTFIRRLFQMAVDFGLANPLVHSVNGWRSALAAAQQCAGAENPETDPPFPLLAPSAQRVSMGVSTVEALSECIEEALELYGEFLSEKDEPEGFVASRSAPLRAVLRQANRVLMDIKKRSPSRVREKGGEEEEEMDEEMETEPVVADKVQSLLGKLEQALAPADSLAAAAVESLVEMTAVQSSSIKPAQFRQIVLECARLCADRSVFLSLLSIAKNPSTRSKETLSLGVEWVSVIGSLAADGDWEGVAEVLDTMARQSASSASLRMSALAGVMSAFYKGDKKGCRALLHFLDPDADPQKPERPSKFSPQLRLGVVISRGVFDWAWSPSSREGRTKEGKKAAQSRLSVLMAGLESKGRVDTRRSGWERRGKTGAQKGMLSPDDISLDAIMVEIFALLRFAMGRKELPWLELPRVLKNAVKKGAEKNPPNTVEALDVLLNEYHVARFQRLGVPHLVSLAAAYGKVGDDGGAQRVLRLGQLLGVANPQLFVAVLQAISQRDWRKGGNQGGQALVVFRQLQDLDPSKPVPVLAFNFAMSSLVKSRNDDLALELFHELMGQEKDHAGKGERGEAHRAAVSEMNSRRAQGDGSALEFGPNFFSFNFAIEAADHLGDHDLAMQLLEELISHGFKPDLLLLNRVLHAHAQSGDIEGMHRVLDRMALDGFHPDSASFNHLLFGAGRAGDVDAAREWISDKEQAAKEGRWGVHAVSVVDINQLLKAMSEKGQVKAMVELLSKLYRSGPCLPDQKSYLISMRSAHLKQADLSDALALLDMYESDDELMKQPSIWVWGEMMALCNEKKDFAETLRVFSRMRAASSGHVRALTPEILQFAVEATENLEGPEAAERLRHEMRQGSDSRRIELEKRMRRRGESWETSVEEAERAGEGHRLRTGGGAVRPEIELRSRTEGQEMAELFRKLEHAPSISYWREIVQHIFSLNPRRFIFQRGHFHRIFSSLRNQGLVPTTADISWVLGQMKARNSVMAGGQAAKRQRNLTAPDLQTVYLVMEALEPLCLWQEAMWMVLTGCPQFGVTPDALVFAVAMRMAVRQRQSKAVLSLFHRMVESGIDPPMSSELLVLRAFAAEGKWRQSLVFIDEIFQRAIEKKQKERPKETAGVGSMKALLSGQSHSSESEGGEKSSESSETREQEQNRDFVDLSILFTDTMMRMRDARRRATEKAASPEHAPLLSAGPPNTNHFRGDSGALCRISHQHFEFLLSAIESASKARKADSVHAIREKPPAGLDQKVRTLRKRLGGGGLEARGAANAKYVNAFDGRFWIASALGTDLPSVRESGVTDAGVDSEEERIRRAFLGKPKLEPGIPQKELKVSDVNKLTEGSGKRGPSTKKQKEARKRRRVKDSIY
uniref:Uncharacterized protein n=1 Tax=Chromera velia CCMP2878 TaxID=1169474 RepID=A0A0G4HUH5_9ALVE|eukprot:Cvel_8639.t1-p1 / transcript=Cvel_8639.t1 / gene=Cvel_8639 / organism=Chromera_velia_CCMP2878 / gene_product=Pentatricopeptide repeat-containing protein, putative / transcript_product=Pentatricopeptide repeat-containing protein, putative / location=Cvel_scaffold481:37342-53802(-) / protein_length=3362 / sequence_SO=supercontig / SO=protein_coding / is_pseudo=false